MNTLTRIGIGALALGASVIGCTAVSAGSPLDRIMPTVERDQAREAEASRRGAVRPVCVGDVITVALGERVACDVVPPQRLDVDVDGAADPLAECEWMGGELIWSDDETTSAHYTCEGVDY